MGQGMNGKYYIIASVCLFLLTLGSIFLYREVLFDLPNVNLIYNPPKLSSKILDKDGNILYKFYEDENRSWVTIDKIPQSLIWATIAIEDKDFYNHHGISLKGLLKASIYNFRKGDNDKLRGGSTITQQLVKNVFFDGTKSMERKFKEAVLSVLIEFKLSKSEILEKYFNQVAYGGETYGAQEAALRYFGKNVWEINMNEAAFLAGLPAAPSSYSPFGENPQYAFLRQKHVIDEMVNSGFIDKNTADELKKEKITIIRDTRKIVAPHFVFFVKNLLDKKYGYNNFNRQGLIITTSLDKNVQEIGEKIVKDEVASVKNLGISNGAALVLDVKNGDILAMIGSKDYNANDIDGKYNVTTALRQPGSSIKPINYLLALEKGMSLSSIIGDTPVIYSIKGQKPYVPQNYTGKYMGNVTLRMALASSLNVPSVKLLEKNGVDNMINLGQKMGITTWADKSRFGLSLALGSGEVRMTELAGAYSVFANMGDKVEVNPILEIKNYLGEVIYKKETEKKQLIRPANAFLINDALSDNMARSPIFGLYSKLKIDNKTVAVKTGTTNNLKDNWCIGWTPSYLVAAWVGNNNSTPMNWVASGITGATPIWQKIMKKMIDGKEDEKWVTPTGVYKAKACGKEDYFVDGNEKSIKCGYYNLTPTITR